MPVELNKKLFNSHLRRLLDAWNDANPNNEYSTIAGVDAILLMAGDGEDDNFTKGMSFQQWLLVYEFPSTLIFFEKDKVTFLCSASKAKILSQLEKNAPVPIEILAQPKPKDPPNDSLSKFVERFASKERVGTLLKEQPSGKLIAEWNKALEGAASKPELVDISHTISAVLSTKDAEEMKAVTTAAALTSTLLRYHVATKLEMILDKEAKISHEAFASQIETRLGSGEGDNAKGPDMKVWNKGKGIQDVDFGLVDFCYPPVVISKSSSSGYDIRFSAVSTNDNIAHNGVLLVAFALRYRGYAANVGRTWIVDPTPEQEAQYNLLLSLQTELLSKIGDGVVAKDVYQHALDYVRDKSPDLEKHFVKNIGFSMGIELRDATFLLSSKNNRTIHSSMVFNLALGFTDLTDKNGRSKPPLIIVWKLGTNTRRYALQLADTIKVDGSRSVLLTDALRSAKDVLLFLNAEEDETKPKKSERKPPVQPKANGSPAKNKTVAGKVLRNQRRAKQEEDQSHLQRFIDHQRELHQKIQDEGLERYTDGAGGKKNEDKTWKKFQSYKGELALPPDVERLRVFVDRKAQTVILPINGFAVPFHINTIKNVSKNDEGDLTYLRINFQTPGQLAGKKEDTPFENPDATFVRSVSFRSPDGARFDNLQKQITDLKKEANKREQQRKQLADVIDQDKLVEIKGRRPIRTSDMFVRPALDGKRLPGDVEIHQNGVRFVSAIGQRIDILFNNVKHLFFQPCDHELLVIIHFHLKAPIMVGKRKATDIQFFREATDVQFDETGNRKRKHRYGDEDEIEQEQQERKRRQTLNKEVKGFAEKIADAAAASIEDTFELDIPFRELSFEGVPFRSGVRLQPTTECLVHLTDPPFLVVTLSEIEIASLERVQYGLKQFDLVFIFHDYTKTPLHINSISTSQIDDVKNWLDSVDIPMSEGPVNLNWGQIMKHINEDPHEFFLQGGWVFLGGPEGAQADGSSGEDDTESEFEEESAFEESDSASASDFSEDASASEASGSFSGSDVSDEGDDWDELERKAAKSDKKRLEQAAEDSDDDKPKKKKVNGTAKKPVPNGKSKGRR
ncbi:FACT complex subunit-domain-containing protein [Schizophyllum amplum]|uniref:FACT complex subunit n=1 Tax=Schizophyllum amplum TaxID=97359 RepID=A0A550C3K6_9AGAR|nr:FACT complex subunit-domain-containing protein [Auriculariopsis ampla]